MFPKSASPPEIYAVIQSALSIVLMTRSIPPLAPSRESHSPNPSSHPCHPADKSASAMPALPAVLIDNSTVNNFYSISLERR